MKSRENDDRTVKKTKLKGGLAVEVECYGTKPWNAYLMLNDRTIARASSGKMLDLAFNEPQTWAKTKINERLNAISKERSYLVEKDVSLANEEQRLLLLQRAHP